MPARPRRTAHRRSATSRRYAYTRPAAPPCAHVRPPAQRSAAAYILARQATGLLQRTRLHVTLTCQSWHAKNARHMLLDVVDFVGPALLIVGSRGMGQLKRSSRVSLAEAGIDRGARSVDQDVEHMRDEVHEDDQWDTTVPLWNAKMNTKLHMLAGPDDSVHSVAFSSTSKLVIFGSYDESVRIWNVNMGAELRVLRGHIDYVYSVAFSTDDKRIVPGSDSKTVQI
jgi:hypothetical protein